MINARLKDIYSGVCGNGDYSIVRARSDSDEVKRRFRIP